MNWLAFECYPTVTVCCFGWLRSPLRGPSPDTVWIYNYPHVSEILTYLGWLSLHPTSLLDSLGLSLTRTHTHIHTHTYRHTHKHTHTHTDTHTDTPPLGAKLLCYSRSAALLSLHQGRRWWFKPVKCLTRKIHKIHTIIRLSCCDDRIHYGTSRPTTKLAITFKGLSLIISKKPISVYN